MLIPFQAASGSSCPKAAEALRPGVGSARTGRGAARSPSKGAAAPPISAIRASAGEPAKQPAEQDVHRCVMLRIATVEKNRKRVVSGKGVSDRVIQGVGRIFKK